MGKPPVGYFLCWIRFSAFVTMRSIIRRTIIQLIFIVGYFTSQLAVELTRSMSVNFTRIIKICSHLMECNRGHVAVQFIFFLRLVLPTRVCNPDRNKISLLISCSKISMKKSFGAKAVSRATQSCGMLFLGNYTVWALIDTFQLWLKTFLFRD